MYSSLLKLLFTDFSLFNYYDIILDLGVFTGLYWQLLLPGKYCNLVKLQKNAVTYIYRTVLYFSEITKYCGKINYTFNSMLL